MRVALVRWRAEQDGEFISVVPDIDHDEVDAWGVIDLRGSGKAYQSSADGVALMVAPNVEGPIPGALVDLGDDHRSRLPSLTGRALANRLGLNLVEASPGRIAAELLTLHARTDDESKPNPLVGERRFPRSKTDQRRRARVWCAGVLLYDELGAHVDEEAVYYAETFPTQANPLTAASQDLPWDVAASNDPFAVSSGGGYAYPAGGNWSEANQRMSTSHGTADHWAEVVGQIGSSDAAFGPLIRAQTASLEQGYSAVLFGSSLRIMRSFAYIATTSVAAALNTDHTVKIEGNGSTLTATWAEGSANTNTTDTTYSGTRAGIMGFNSQGPTTARIYSFSTALIGEGPGGGASVIDADVVENAATVHSPEIGLPTETLVDTFDGNTLDSERWPEQYGASFTVDDALTIGIAPDYSNVIISKDLYRLKDSQIAWENVYLPGQGNGSKECYVEFGGDFGNSTVWCIYNGSSIFSAYRIGGGSTTYGPGVPANMATHRFVRVRESGGTIYFEQSGNGINWLTFETISTPAWIETANNGQIVLFAGHWSTESSDLVWTIDNFNAVQSPYDPGVFFAEDWSGSGGWAANRWHTVNQTSGSSATIESGWGRLTTGTEGGYADGSYQGIGAVLPTDFTIKTSIKPTTLDECFPTIFFRSEGVTVADCYLLEFAPSYGGVRIQRHDNYVVTDLVSTGWSYALDQEIHVEISCVGDDIEVRLWDDGDSRPATPTLTATDATWDGPWMTFGLNGGDDTASKTVDFGPVEITLPLQTVVADFIQASATVYSPTVISVVSVVEADVVACPVVVHSPTIAVGPVVVETNVVVLDTSVYAPAVEVGSITLVPDLVADPAAVNIPAVTVGEVSIEPTLVTTSLTVPNPTVTVGEITITVDLINTSATVLDPTVTVGETVIEPTLVAASATVLNPAVSVGGIVIAVELIDSSAIVYAPTVVATETIIVVPLVITSGYGSGGYGSGEYGGGVLEPTVVAAAAIITTNLVDSPSTILEPTVDAGEVYVAVELVVASVTVQLPSVKTTSIIAPEVVTAGATVHAPTVTVGAATVVPEVVVTIAVIYPPSLADTIEALTLATTTTVHDPDVTQRVSAPVLNTSPTDTSVTVFPPSVSVVLFAPVVSTESNVLTPKVLHALTIPVVVNAADVFSPVVETFAWVGTELVANPASVLRPSVLWAGRFSVTQVITVVELVQNIRVTSLSQSADVEDVVQDIEMIG